MDTLHSVLRAIGAKPERRRDHLAVFREFLVHLDRAARAAPRPPSVKAGKPPSHKPPARKAPLRKAKRPR